MSAALTDASTHAGAPFHADVSFRNVSLGYNRHAAVHHLNGTMMAGCLTAIVGPNGSGKSTLCKGILGILKPMHGTIHIRGLARRDIAWLPQLAEIDRSFPATLFELVAMGVLRVRGFFAALGKADEARIHAAIAAVGLSGFENAILDTLSGGQLQRALFARVIVQDSPLIILDEPFTAVDTRTSDDLARLVTRWHSDGRTVIAVLHDLEMVRRVFPQTLLLARDQIGWGPTQDILTPDNLRRAGAMREAWDVAAPWCEAPREDAP